MGVLRHWFPALLYMVVIWTVSSLSHVEAFHVEDFPLKDKGAHFVEYAGLAFFVAHACLRTWPDRATWRLVITAVIITTGWGVLDEFHQAFVPERSPDPTDALADLLGATTGACFRAMVSAYFRRRAAAQTPASP